MQTQLRRAHNPAGQAAHPVSRAVSDAVCLTMQALADASYLRLSEFAPQAISNTIWSFANVGISHMRLTRAVVEQLAGESAGYSLRRNGIIVSLPAHEGPS